MQTFDILNGLSVVIITKIFQAIYPDDEVTLNFSNDEILFYEKIIFRDETAKPSYNEMNQSLISVVPQVIQDSQAEQTKLTKDSKFQTKYPIQDQIILIARSVNPQTPELKDMLIFYDSLHD